MKVMMAGRQPLRKSRNQTNVAGTARQRSGAKHGHSNRAHQHLHIQVGVGTFSRATPFRAHAGSGARSRRKESANGNQGWWLAFHTGSTNHF
mmetsp:Transcript_14769/g.28606  ORF Transcript_14769/g.28606 Transcript_14769/m.28606 type:complete len:92 (-) Transcript_14769:124-399(-)